MAPPISPRRTRVKNATQRPGLVLLEGKKKRRTQAQIKEDKQHAEEAQAAQEAALQRGIDRIAGIEAAMEVEQGTQSAAKAKPVKPRARPVKKKLDGAVAANELTSSSLPVAPAPANKGQGGMKSQGIGGIGEGSSGAVGNEITKPTKKTKKKLHEAATRQILDGDQRIEVEVPDTDKKGNHVPNKKCLAGKVNNWQNRLEPETESAVSPVVRAEPEPSGGSVLSATTRLKTSQTAATTISFAKDPPLSLTDSSDGSIPDNSEDGGNEKDGDEDGDEDSKEHLAALADSVKGKVGMKSVVQIAESSDDGMSEVQVSTPFHLLPFSQQADIVRFALEQARPHAASSTKRTIEEAGLIGSSEDYDPDDIEEEEGEEDEFVTDSNSMLVNEESSSIVEVLKPTRTTTKTSVTVASTEKPKPLKKPKLEPALLTISESSLMSADLATKPKSGNQWQNTDLPPIMLEDGAWRRSFIPTVFLWAGSQPNFWCIEAEKLHPALQAIFDVAFPGMNHNVQPKGPIMGLVNQRLCSWRSNFGSTAIALVTNFLATSKDNDIDNDEDEDDYEQELAASLLENWAFLYEDPDNCDPNKIYRSVFILEMIESAHINATAGSLDVPALNTDALRLNGMQGVIAASAAALERAFNIATKPKNFADTFSTGTSSVKGSIKARKTPLKRNKSTSKDNTIASAFS
ncbi:uncharacterized protein F5147DRAFT_780314 [Suillus discolor]|uniref:DUF6532 domain-containing protein n=1 Tax=Suillus discolor TaxID=1912936 RepID=A0A9P7JN11_9AGAM|nr:uncharacterized protein F5147DRAFT_780314 [Suillus discolor]KAG2090358.1 hypothetical protein F5147DRAFT_780314 [Suillus discolor]